MIFDDIYLNRLQSEIYVDKFSRLLCLYSEISIKYLQKKCDFEI
jgi:hypothetical protein